MSQKNGVKMILSEVVDSPESAKEFLEINGINQEQIKCIVIVWDEIVDLEYKGDEK